MWGQYVDINKVVGVSCSIMRASVSLHILHIGDY